MTVVYDDAERHHATLPGDLPRKAAATHIGQFFAWAAKSGLVSDFHGQEHGEDFSKLKRSWFTGRDYVLAALEGRLTSEHLNAEGRAFADAYYASGTYLTDYEAHLRHFSPSLYHVRSDWETYAELAGVLDERLAAFREGRGAPAVSAPAAPSPSEPPAVAEPELDGVSASPEPAAPPRAAAPPPPPPPPLPTRRVKAPPPLPKHRPPRRSSGAAPKRTSRLRDKAPRARGKFWILAVVLTFVGVRGCAALLDPKEPRRAPHEDVFERVQRENRDRTRQMQEHAERMRRLIHDSNQNEAVRRAAWVPPAPEQEEAAREAGLPPKFENGFGMRFVLIPPGTFIMGSPVGEPERGEDESLHNVEISRPFYMLTTEVSNALFRRFRPQHKSGRPSGLRSFNSGAQPVTSVDHTGAVEFCTWLEERDPGRSYRLPTEAEWEYACRAGGMERFWWGEDESAAGRHANVADRLARARFPGVLRRAVEATEGWRWFETDDQRVGLASVGSYRPNAWGLYDMLGNVRECCADWHGAYVEMVFSDPTGPIDGMQRVLRGGAFDTPVGRTRCAARESMPPGVHDLRTGFRVVSTPRE